MTLAIHSEVVAQADMFWIWPAIGASIGLALFCRGFRILQRKRLLVNTPPSKIRSAALGLIEVSGLAVGPYTLTAPITGNPCYYYRTIAWELQKSGKDESWKKVADESFHVPFYVDDNTGKLLVNPQHAEMDIDRDFHQEYAGNIFCGNNIPAGVSSFLMRHGISGIHKIKLEEYCIKPKNALFIMGTLAENSGPAVSPKAIQSKEAALASITVPLPGDTKQLARISLRSAPGIAMRSMSVEFEHNLERSGGTTKQQTIYLSPQATTLSSAEMTQQGKIAAALVKAGINKPAAWEAAGLDAPGATAAMTAPVTASAIASDHAKESFDLQPKVVLRQGEKNSTFMISWRAQQSIVNSMGWASFLYLWGGPTLVLLSVYVLLARLGWL